MKRCRIRVSPRKTSRAVNSPYTFGVIRDESPKATPGERLESLIATQDEIAVTFEDLVNRNGFALDFNRHGGWGKICCISTAFTGYLRAGDELFEKALLVLQLAWKGHPDSLRHEVLDSVLRFIEIYDDEIDLEPDYTALSSGTYQNLGGREESREPLFRISTLFISDLSTVYWNGSEILSAEKILKLWEVDN